MSSQASSSSQSASPDPQAPRCGMNDLPTEVKARIVELCAEQDEQFKRWLSSKTSLVADLNKHNMMHGRSVGALFQVSKEFSTLAAPHLFKVLKVSAVDFRFQYSIAKTRLPLFSELDFDSGGRTSAMQILPYISRMTGVKVLKLKEVLLRGYWESDVPSVDFSRHKSTSAQFAAMSFASLTRITELWVEDLSTSRYSRLLPPFRQNLRILRVLYTDYHRSLSDGTFGAVLSSMPNLEELCIHQAHVYTVAQTTDLSPVTQALTMIPHLRRLFLTFTFLHSSHLTFAKTFSSTLERLGLNSNSDLKSYPHRTPFVQPRFTTEVFPVLTSFVFKGEHAASGGTLASLKPRNTPALKRLELRLRDVPTWSGDASPLANFTPFPHLASLKLVNFDLLPVPALKAIAKFCRNNDIELRNSSDEAVPIRKPSETADKADKTDESSPSESPVCKRLIRTLDYLEATAKKAQERDDLATLNRLTEALKGLELQRQAEEAWEEM
ncbi:hypothetical protein JCM6882_001473 [Rhodosporidiobolus microsporus]